MKRIGVSEMRRMNAANLREMEEAVEICHKNQPLRVMIPWNMYLQLQDILLGSQREQLNKILRIRCDRGDEKP